MGKKKKKGNFRYNRRNSITSGERKVIEFLKKNNIHYLREITFPKLINPATGNHLYFDFYLPKYRTIVEVQGNQHYVFTPEFHKTMENFEYQQKKDEFKRIFCLENNYQLIEIDYGQVNNLKKFLAPYIKL